jgi:hypothetical protein
MSSAQDKPLDLSALSEKYEIVGEYAALGHNRRYPGRRREDGADVLVTVLRATPDLAQGTGKRERPEPAAQTEGLGRSKAIAQFAADANLMVGLSHPNMPRVFEGRWLGDDAFAIVTERINGVTLGELLRGDRIPKPRLADILADVDGVLEWARNERLSHRGVTPDGIWIERGTNRVFVALGPMETPKTNRPDPRDDARTIGALALAALTAKPMTDEHDDTLISKRPDLPQRVATATEKLATCTINDEVPDVAAYLASLAMADAIKEGEVEVARLEAEHRAQMKAEREKWEAEQEACRLENEDQAKKFAAERAEYERRSAKEREQLAAARAEVDQRRAEVQLARKELDDARAVYKEKKAALEARAKQVDKHMAELEKQKRALERRAAELEQRNLELQQFAALAASGSAEDIAQRPTMEVAAFDEPAEEPEQEDVAVLEEAVEAEETVKAWTPIETEEPWGVPLESDEPVREIQYEAAAVPDKEPAKRPAWVVPAGIAGAVLVLAGAAFAVSRSDRTAPVLQTVATTRVPAPPAPSALRTDSAAGNVDVMSDSVVFNAIRDSIVAADEARRIRRQRAAEEAAAAEAEQQRRAARTMTDSNGTVWLLDKPANFGSNQVIKLPDTLLVKPKIDTIKPDTALKPRPDTGGKPKPDTLKPKPDTLKCCN